MVARGRAAELAAAAAADSSSQRRFAKHFARKSSMGGIRRQHKHQHQQHQKQSATLTNADPDAAAAAAAAAEEDACYEEARAGVMLRPFPHQHGVDCGVNCLNSGGGSVGGDSSEQNRLASTELGRSESFGRAAVAGSRLHPLNFCFDPLIRVASNGIPSHGRHAVSTSRADLSYGKERIPVPAVNCLDADEPPFIDYTPQRMPLLLNVCTNEADKGFLVCCDCTRRLSGPNQAAQTAVQPTRTGASFRALIGGGVRVQCNSGCSCRQWQCRNRLVQRGLHSRLPDTSKPVEKGWGLRPLHDLPKGAFVCVYAGTATSSEMSTKLTWIIWDGHGAGRNSATRLKLSSPINSQLKQKSWLRKSQSQSSLTNDNGDNEDPDEEPTGRSRKSQKKRKQQKKKRLTTTTQNDEDYCGDSRRKRSSTAGASANRSEADWMMRQSALLSPAAATVPKAGSGCCSQQNAQDHCSMHDDEDAGAIAATAAAAGSPCSQPLSSIANADQMDEAKTTTSLKLAGQPPASQGVARRGAALHHGRKRIGNLGRYLNHSCAPNVIVQNVFVNTHDPRFPEIAFFTCKRVRAGRRAVLGL
uniref:SET domain-containing protein n=1 Tax=Macrostomum lignano TaxID=282301 RepID=A0A1I8FJV4_9PLAT